MRYTLPNQSVEPNAGEGPGFAENSRVALSHPPGVAQLGRSATSERIETAEGIF